jgi:hypothetical protein
MKGHPARQLASDWLSAHGERAQDVTDSYSWLAGEISDLLSDDAVAGIANAEGTPVVIAADGQRFFVIGVPASGDGQVTVNARSLPIDQLQIEVSDVIEPQAHRLLRRRTWKLNSAGTDPATITTEELLKAPFPSDTGPDSGELAMRELARRAGWPLSAEALAED